MTNNNTQTVTISVARYKQLEGLLDKARGRARTYEQANKTLAARVAELEEDKDALERRLGDVQADRDEWRHCHAMLQDENAELKARVAELENLYQKRGEAYEEERKEHEAALEVEEKRRWALEDVINELFERIEELGAARDAIQADGEELLEENKALMLEKADLIREKHAAESRAELAECFLLSLQTEIDVVSSSAMISGDYKGQMDYLAEVAKRFEL